MTHEVSFDLGKKPVESVSKTQKRMDPYATMSARIKPESFWHRLKRSLFGSGAGLEKIKMEEAAMSQRIATEQARLKQVSREVQVQSPKTSIETQRALLDD